MFRESISIFVAEWILLCGIVLGWKIFKLQEFLAGGCVLVLIMILTFIFFRDPERIIPEGNGLIVSPGDGRILQVEEVISCPYLNESAKKVSIYISMWDVHVNRIPINGEIKFMEYRSGKFFSAFKSKASEQNEQMIIGIEGKEGKVLVKQIAGAMARRIVCRLKLGDAVHRGERFGIIKFGSRLEIYFPISTVFHVSRGEKVRGGESIIGVISRGI